MSKLFVVETPIGIFGYSEDKKLALFTPAPKELDNNVEYLLKVEKGEPNETYSEFFKKVVETGYKTIVVETYETGRIASGYGLVPEVSPANEISKYVRSILPDLAVSVSFLPSREEFYKWLHDVMVEYTRRKLRKEAQKRDLLAVQAIRAMDDIDKTINLYVARLREWYSIHFPELDELIKEHPEYAKLVYELGDRSNFTVENLIKMGYSEERAKKIAEAAKASIGADLSDFDMNYIKVLAGIILELYRLRSTLDEYVEAVMKEVAPNITALVGARLGARLLSLAGGLEELAKLPASTIQVLGAEKALFRALRTGGKPPKHGVIFQHPAIHKSPRWQRGKIARALAAKLAIAAKVDLFSGRNMGERLVKEFEERVEEIKKLYPKPPPREAKPAQPPKSQRKEKRREKR